MPGIKLPGPRELDLLTSAVKKAEEKTSAELVVLIVNRSGHYSAQALSFALLAVAFCSALFFLFLPSMEGLLLRFLWQTEPRELLLAFALSQLLVFWTTFLLFRFRTGLIAGLIPGPAKASKVRERAEAAFFRHNLRATTAANGVLIYVSLLEKRVELIADTSAGKAVNHSDWEKVVFEIIRGIRKNNFLKALCQQIEHCGDLLAVHFPRQAEDRNELPDRPILEAK